MNIPPKYEDVVAKLDAAQTEIKCLKAVLNGMEFKQVDDMVLDGVDACLFLGQESARITKGIQAERNGLREELERTKKAYEAYGIDFDRSEEKSEALQQRLTVAEQRAGELELENAELKSGILTILQNSDRTAEMLSGENESSKADEKSGIAPKGPFPPGPHIDQQGYKIKIGVAYRFVFGMPGPDVTSVIVESFNDDGSVNVFDPSFKIKAENLGSGRFWRPLMRGWDDISDRKAIVEYAGESALDLTP